MGQGKAILLVWNGEGSRKIREKQRLFSAQIELCSPCMLSVIPFGFTAWPVRGRLMRQEFIEPAAPTEEFLHNISHLARN